MPRYAVPNSSKSEKAYADSPAEERPHHRAHKVIRSKVFSAPAVKVDLIRNITETRTTNKPRDRWIKSDTICRDRAVYIVQIIGRSVHSVGVPANSDMPGSTR